jgi:hypothetical protein
LPIGDDSAHGDWFGDILYIVAAQGFEADLQLVLHVIGDGASHRDAAGRRQLLEAGSDDDAFTMAIIALDDHVAEVDANAHVDTLAVGEAVVSLGHAALQDDGAFNGVDDAAELGQQSVAHQLEDAAVMLLDLRFEQLFAVSAQAFERGRFVLLDQAAVADDVDG